MKDKITVEIIQEPEKGRKDSFWFDGEVASVSLGKRNVSIQATGHIRVAFNEDEDMYVDEQARKEARNRGYTDRKLKNMSNHDGWSNNNWFGYLVTEEDGSTHWDEATDIKFDDAVFGAKQILLKK